MFKLIYTIVGVVMLVFLLFMLIMSIKEVIINAIQHNQRINEEIDELSPGFDDSSAVWVNDIDYDEINFNDDEHIGV